MSETPEVDEKALLKNIEQRESEVRNQLMK